MSSINTEIKWYLQAPTTFYTSKIKLIPSLSSILNQSLSTVKHALLKISYNQHTKTFNTPNYIPNLRFFFIKRGDIKWQLWPSKCTLATNKKIPRKMKLGYQKYLQSDTMKPRLVYTHLTKKIMFYKTITLYTTNPEPSSS